MSNPNSVTAVLEAALEVAVAGLKRAKAEKNVAAMMAYHDVLSSAYNVAEALDFQMPGAELASLDPDVLMGMGPRSAD